MVWIKGAVYTVWIFLCICMSLRVFLFAKKMKFLTKGGIQCISQVFPWHFYKMREHSFVELTEHDDSAANIIVHSMHTYMYFFFSFSFSFISLIADGPHHYHPACGHKGSSHLSPVHALQSYFGKNRTHDFRTSRCAA